MPLRRPLLATALAAVLPVAGARAQPAPRQAGQPLRLVVPFPAGGATDAVARLFAPALGARLSQNVIVDNRPGAGGIPAAELVVRAAPDGNTLLLATSSIHSTAPAVNPAGLPFDPERDFAPLALLGVTASLILVSGTVPANSLREFIAWARARRGAVNYGSSGVGTTPHLNGALFDALAGTGMVHVPYRGTGAVYAELRRGDVHALLDVPATAAPHLASGTVRALATTAPGETPLAPGVPTAEAAGLPGLVSETWFGIFGPAGLPPAVAQHLAAAAVAAMSEPELRQRFLSIGVEPRAEGPEALATRAREERARWTELVRRLGIRVSD
jgi:tripartite-type tricarboxylate transporter receptor subunit TctC